MKLVRNQINILFRKKEGFINPLFFALLFSFSCFSQEPSSYPIDLFNFNHQKLKEDLQLSSPEDRIFYTNKITFLNLLFNETPISEALLETYENSIDSLENITFTEPKLQYYYIGEAQLILSLIHVKFGNKMSSASYFIKAYGSFEKNLKDYPTFKDPEIALNFMKISASILPKSLQWITSWFGVESDEEEAITKLKNIYSSTSLSPLAMMECYALNLYLKLQFDIEVIQEQSNINLTVFNILQSEIYNKQKAYTLMVESILSIPDQMSIKYFLLGKAYFITENSGSKKALETFISNTKTTNNISAAYFYLYQLNILNSEDSLKNRNLTIKQYPQQNFRDKWAKSEIHKLQTPFSIRLRNAFDRGDYQTCIQLTQHSSPIKIQELYYLTNSYIKIEDKNLAKTSYIKLLNLSKKDQYYIPKTGLNLAMLIYKDEPELAKSILREIKSYKNYPYEKEIEAKSDLLLKTL